jgi:hypothetical protein
MYALSQYCSVTDLHDDARRGLPSANCRRDELSEDERSKDQALAHRVCSRVEGKASRAQSSLIRHLRVASSACASVQLDKFVAGRLATIAQKAHPCVTTPSSLLVMPRAGMAWALPRGIRWRDRRRPTRLVRRGSFPLPSASSTRVRCPLLRST